MNSYTEQLTEYAGALAKWTLEDGNNLMTYLNVLSHFPGEYTVNNQLLIMGYRVDAEYINGLDEWNNLGVMVREDASPIVIIEPYGEGFREKYMYDVKDTDTAWQKPVYDKATVLEALIASAGKIDVVDEIKKGVRAMYIPDEKLIRVKRSSELGFDKFFTAIASELYHSRAAEEKGGEGTYKRATNLITSKAVAWALGARYNMDLTDISLANLPEKYSSLSSKGCKTELEKIKAGFDSIAKDMDLALAEITKRREKQLER